MNNNRVLGQLARIQAAVAAAEQRLETSKSLAEVGRLSLIPTPPPLRQAARPLLCRLKSAAERRAEEILEQQIRRIERAGSVSEAGHLRDHLRRVEWPYLQARFPHLYRKAFYLADAALRYRGD